MTEKIVCPDCHTPAELTTPDELSERHNTRLPEEVGDLEGLRCPNPECVRFGEIIGTAETE